MEHKHLHDLHVKEAFLEFSKLLSSLSNSYYAVYICCFFFSELEVKANENVKSNDLLVELTSQQRTGINILKM